MRIPAKLVPLLLMAACSPMRPETPPLDPARPENESPALLALAVPVVKSTPLTTPRLAVREISGIKFEGVAFDSRDHRMIVVDQENGPGANFPDSAAAAGSRNGIAAVNAGFFTPEGAPLGLVVANGTISGAWNSASSLGSGVWCEDSNGHAAIVRRENIRPTHAKATRELVQAGPLLVENSKPVGGLEGTKASARSFVLWDGGTRWWIGRSSSCTLAALGNAVGNGEVCGWKVRQALNLDGGRSSDLWVSSQVSGGPLNRRAPWNRPVRNFLVLVPRR